MVVFRLSLSGDHWAREVAEGGETIADLQQLRSEATSGRKLLLSKSFGESFSWGYKGLSGAVTRAIAESRGYLVHGERIKRRSAELDYIAGYADTSSVFHLLILILIVVFLFLRFIVVEDGRWILGMDESAALAVGACALAVVGLAYFGLVLRMSQDRSKFSMTMSELALGTVAAIACLFERAAELSLVEVLSGDVLFNVALLS